MILKLLTDTQPIWKQVLVAGLTTAVTVFATKSVESLFEDEKENDEDEEKTLDDDS